MLYLWSQTYGFLLVIVQHQIATEMEWDHINVWLLEEVSVNDGRLLYQIAFCPTALSEREEEKDTASFMLLGLCVILSAWITQLVYIWWPFSAFKTVFNIKNIFFPKIHWVLSVKSHLSPVKIFPSTAFLYKALITQFAESALETLRSEAWRIFFSFKRRERKEKKERRGEAVCQKFSLSCPPGCIYYGHTGKKEKKRARRKRRKKGRRIWEWKGEIKGKQKFHPKPGILQAVIFQLIEKTLNKKSSLENRKCCDYKVEHFISTNWSLNVLWESNCSVQIGRKKYDTAWRRIFFPFWFITAFFFFLLIIFWHSFFFPAIRASSQTQTKQCNA